MLSWLSTVQVMMCIQTRLPTDSSLQLMGAKTSVIWTSFSGTLSQEVESEDTTNNKFYEKVSANDLPEIL